MIPCNAYDNGKCLGTREIDPCNCGGDIVKCDFYPYVREEAKKHENILEPCDKSKYPEMWGPMVGKSAEERIQYIYEIALDWDGYRTAKGLGELVDEILAYCCAPKEPKRPLNYHEVLSLPVGTLIWVEHGKFDDVDCATVYNGNPGPGYGRLYRYWRGMKPTQDECINAKWD